MQRLTVTFSCSEKKKKKNNLSRSEHLPNLSIACNTPGTFPQEFLCKMIPNGWKHLWQFLRSGKEINKTSWKFSACVCHLTAGSFRLNLCCDPSFLVIFGPGLLGCKCYYLLLSFPRGRAAKMNVAFWSMLGQMDISLWIDHIRNSKSHPQ